MNGCKARTTCSWNITSSPFPFTWNTDYKITRLKRDINVNVLYFNFITSLQNRLADKWWQIQSFPIFFIVVVGEFKPDLFRNYILSVCQLLCFLNKLYMFWFILEFVCEAELKNPSFNFFTRCLGKAWLEYEGKSPCTSEVQSDVWLKFVANMLMN